MTDRYVVIGNPVAHSQSPFIHTAFARQTGQDMEYGRLLCPPEGFEATLAAFAAGGGRGCNVTVPFKFDAYQLAGAHTLRGATAGACNVLRRDGAHWLGDNSDGAGLLRDIERNAGVALADRRILLLGAGGAAAGVLAPLLAARPAALVLANRTLPRALELLQAQAAAVDAARHADTDVHAASLDDCGNGFDVVINATSSSLLGAAVPVSEGVLRTGALAIDLMYGPAARAFLAWAEGHGAVARDGLGMLVEQAAVAFELFRGIEPETAPVLAALRQRMAGTST